MDHYKQTEMIDVARLLGFFHAEKGKKDDTLTVLKRVAEGTHARLNAEMMQAVVDAYNEGQKEQQNGRSLSRLINIYQNAKKDSIEAIFRTKEFYWNTVQRSATALL